MINTKTSIMEHNLKTLKGRRSKADDLNTSKGRLAKIDELKGCQYALTNALDKAHKADAKYLSLMLKNTKAKIKYLNTSKTWNFGFEGGGWNSVYALDKESAIKLAVAEYDGGEVTYHSVENGGGRIEPLKVRVSSFRVATEEDTAMLMSLFH